MLSNLNKPTRPLTLEEAIALKAQRLKEGWERFKKLGKKRNQSVIFIRPKA
ncbi:hypothetical protein [Kalamiella sp. sgz302252]|uniref:hypothetical protein n=1 Tax=Pantoea sp. sgz302252 TaxID=3341827 RepID=UPI0036D3BD1C